MADYKCMYLVTKKAYDKIANTNKHENIKSTHSCTKEYGNSANIKQMVNLDMESGANVCIHNDNLSSKHDDIDVNPTESSNHGFKPIKMKKSNRNTVSFSDEEEDDSDNLITETNSTVEDMLQKVNQNSNSYDSNITVDDFDNENLNSSDNYLKNDNLNNNDDDLSNDIFNNNGVSEVDDKNQESSIRDTNENQKVLSMGLSNPESGSSSGAANLEISNADTITKNPKIIDEIKELDEDELKIKEHRNRYPDEMTELWERGSSKRLKIMPKTSKANLRKKPYDKNNIGADQDDDDSMWDIPPTKTILNDSESHSELFRNSNWTAGENKALDKKELKRKIDDDDAIQVLRKKPRIKESNETLWQAGEKTNLNRENRGKKRMIDDDDAIQVLRKKPRIKESNETLWQAGEKTNLNRENRGKKRIRQDDVEEEVMSDRKRLKHAQTSQKRAREIDDSESAVEEPPKKQYKLDALPKKKKRSRHTGVWYTSRPRKYNKKKKTQ